MSALTRMSEVRRAFWDDVQHLGWRPRWVRVIGTSGSRPRTQNEYPADIRMAFCDWLDAQERSGRVSTNLAQRATLG